MTSLLSGLSGEIGGVQTGLYVMSVPKMWQLLSPVTHGFATSYYTGDG